MKKYIKPEFEVMLIKAEDVIQTSGLQETVGGEQAQAMSGMTDAQGQPVQELGMDVFN